MNQEIKDTITEKSYLESMGSQVTCFADISPDMLERFMSLIKDPNYQERLEYYSRYDECFILAEPIELFILTNREVSFLWAIKHCKANIVGALKKLERLLLQFITLLFGLCSSQFSVHSLVPPFFAHQHCK